jgi:hypothetical protein
MVPRRWNQRAWDQLEKRVSALELAITRLMSGQADRKIGGIGAATWLTSLLLFFGSIITALITTGQLP